MASSKSTHDPPEADRPLLEWLLLQYPDTPKSRAKQWIQSGRISVGGTILRKPHESIPDPGSALQLLDRQAQNLLCGAGWQIHPRLEILFLDSFLAIVNKGPGLISVPAPGIELCALGILADFLAGRLRVRHPGVPHQRLPSIYRRLRPLPVHRLDQYTSGVFCLAMNPEARHHLIEQVSAHTMKREYIAFVDGRSTSPRGTWHQWLEFNENTWREHVLPDRQAAAAHPKALEAITHYEVVAEYASPAGHGFVTQLWLRLETGRKHQIRAQAAYAGLPLIGDRTYHPAYRDHSRQTLPLPFPRQALHARSLTLEHPGRPGQPVTWTARLPKDLQELEATLRAGLRRAQR
jgi:23S rRNA pseudouridine1911/1915/1917 synthase